MPFGFKLITYTAPLLLFFVLTYVGVSILGYPLLPVVGVVAVFCFLDFLLLKRVLSKAGTVHQSNEIG